MRTGKQPRECLACGESFMEWLCKGTKYCSNKCFGVSISKNKHPLWRGDGVGYSGVHIWINKTYGLADHCVLSSQHKSPRFHWANLSGEYKRDISNWIQLCPSCHRYMDKGFECVWGHKYTEDNIYHYNGYRHCLTCKKIHSLGTKIRERTITFNVT